MRLPAQVNDDGVDREHVGARGGKIFQQIPKDVLFRNTKMEKVPACQNITDKVASDHRFSTSNNVSLR